jgi:hypothetical protein
MKNSNSEETNFENQTQPSSHSPTSSSQNETCESQDTTATQTMSPELKRRYCKNARQKLKAYFFSEAEFDLSRDDGLPCILCDDDIAEKIGVSRWAVYAYRRAHRIPERDVRMDCALKTLFTVTRECFDSVKNFQRLLCEQAFDDPLKTEVAVTIATIATATVTSLFFFLFLM